MFTLIYSKLPSLTPSYPRFTLFTLIYSKLATFHTVFTRLPQVTHVSPCYPSFTQSYPCFTLFSLINPKLLTSYPVFPHFIHLSQVSPRLPTHVYIFFQHLTQVTCVSSCFPTCTSSYPRFTQVTFLRISKMFAVLVEMASLPRLSL